MASTKASTKKAPARTQNQRKPLPAEIARAKVAAARKGVVPEFSKKIPHEEKKALQAMTNLKNYGVSRTRLMQLAREAAGQ